MALIFSRRTNYWFWRWWFKILSSSTFQWTCVTATAISSRNNLQNTSSEKDWV